MIETRPEVRWRAPRATQPAALVLALHGRGADETSLDPVTDRLPDRFAVAAPRGPIASGSGWAWFENRGIGRPLADSLTATIAWLRLWLDQTWSGPTYLFGFSGGTAMAGGMLLSDPARFAGAVLLSGTLPFEAGQPTDDDRLSGLPIFHAHGALDSVIPADLVGRTTEYLAGPAGAAIEQHLYPNLDHRIDDAELTDILTWFEARTP